MGFVKANQDDLPENQSLRLKVSETVTAIPQLEPWRSCFPVNWFCSIYSTMHVLPFAHILLVQDSSIYPEASSTAFWPGTIWHKIRDPYSTGSMTCITALPQG